MVDEEKQEMTSNEAREVQADTDKEFARLEAERRSAEEAAAVNAPKDDTFKMPKKFEPGDVYIFRSLIDCIKVLTTGRGDQRKHFRAVFDRGVFALTQPLCAQEDWTMQEVLDKLFRLTEYGHEFRMVSGPGFVPGGGTITWNREAVSRVKQRELEVKRGMRASGN